MRLLLYTLVFLLPSLLAAQNKAEIIRQVAWADSLLVNLEESVFYEVNSRVKLLDSAAHIYNRASEKCKYIDATVRLSSAYSDLGAADTSLAILIHLEKEYSPSCDSVLYMKILSNYSYLYLGINEFEKLDSICKYGLSIWNNNWSSYEEKLVMLNNWSISRAYQGDLEGAETLFRKLLASAKEYESFEYQARALTNLGTIKGMSNDMDSAYYYLDRASELAAIKGDYEAQIPILINGCP